MHASIKIKVYAREQSKHLKSSQTLNEEAFKKGCQLLFLFKVYLDRDPEQND